MAGVVGLLFVAGLLCATVQRGAATTKPASSPYLASPPSPETIALGTELYGKYCASCHGVNLEGQPDWKRRLSSGKMPAPPHDASGHTWHHSDQDLFRIVKEGVAVIVGNGYESDMLAFGPVLSDDEIWATLAYIESTWPARQRTAQHELTVKAAETMP
ncbi:MAG: c-type cytochrome [Paracoccaceae bacterium]